jgi:microcystin-dependent protein
MRAKSPVGQNRGGLPNSNDASYSPREAGERGGEEEHTLTQAEIPSHTHPLNGKLTTNPAGTNIGDGYNGGFLSDQDTGQSGGDAPHNNMHPFLVVQFIIKT